MSDKRNFKDLIEMLEDAMELVEDNEDKINDLFNRGDQKINLKEGVLLSEVQIKDDEVLIMSEAKGDFDSVGISHNNGEFSINMGDEKLIAEVPDDIDAGGTEANLNNGVLEVKIPREGDN